MDPHVVAETSGTGAHDRAERLTAACYGTVLVLASLAVVDADEVLSGWGWELATGVGVATWLAHLYAEVMGDHVRHAAVPRRREITRAMTNGFPILLATVAPAVMLLLGRLEVMSPRVSLWAAVAVAVIQLGGVAGIAARSIPSDSSRGWVYAAAATALGVVVVALKIALGH